MGGKGGGSAPPAPNYTQAAEMSSADAKKVNAAQTWANRPDQKTPWGQTSWTPRAVIDPSTGEQVTQWAQQTTLNPESQRALDAQMDLTTDRSEFGRDIMGRVRGEGVFGSEFKLPSTLRNDREAAESSIDSFLTSRTSERQGQEQQALEINLRNRGLVPGSEIWNNEMERMSRSHADQWRGVDSQILEQGRAEENLAMALRQQQIGEYNMERSQPLNEVNALLGGQQVSTPGMPSFQSASRAQSTDYLGAADAQYQAGLDAFSINQAQNQSAMSGMFSLGQAAMGMF